MELFTSTGRLNSIIVVHNHNKNHNKRERNIGVLYEKNTLQISAGRRVSTVRSKERRKEKTQLVSRNCYGSP